MMVKRRVTSQGNADEPQNFNYTQLRNDATCYVCNKKGHKERDYWFNPENPNNKLSIKKI